MIKSDYSQHQDLVKYLRTKYDGFIGLPSQMLEDEALERNLPWNVIKPITQRDGNFKTQYFYPFDQAATFIMELNQ